MSTVQSTVGLRKNYDLSTVQGTVWKFGPTPKTTKKVRSEYGSGYGWEVRPPPKTTKKIRFDYDLDPVHPKPTSNRTFFVVWGCIWGAEKLRSDYGSGYGWWVGVRSETTKKLRSEYGSGYDPKLPKLRKNYGSGYERKLRYNYGFGGAPRARCGRARAQSLCICACTPVLPVLRLLFLLSSPSPPPFPLLSAAPPCPLLLPFTLPLLSPLHPPFWPPPGSSPNRHCKGPHRTDS